MPPAHGPRRRRSFVLVELSVLLLAAILVPLVTLRSPDPFVASFDGPDRLVTNERAFHHPDMPGARFSPDWMVTSGSLFTHEDAGWSGPPDNSLPDTGSSDHTGSAVFRVVTRRDDFTDVVVRMRFRVEELVPGEAEHDWDGVHVFLRYQSPDELYGVSVFRRDGIVAVKRKLPGGTEPGRYLTLADAHHPVAEDVWTDVTVRIVTLDSGSVRITLAMEGRHLLTATDRGQHGRRIDTAGRVGVRGDNTQFSFDDFRATPVD